MKIVVTGSLGHIGKPLTQELVRKGHAVTVISSTAERKTDIEALGAQASIGTMKDADFLTAAFEGADIVYVMEAVGQHRFFDPQFDIIGEIDKIVTSYKQAILQSGVKRVVHLSSIGAHTDQGNGLLAFHHRAEAILNQLPEAVSIKFMRPVGFYYNLFAFIPTIKTQGTIISNYGGDEQEPWVSPSDIAAVIAEEMEQPFDGRTIRYIASDEVSPNEVAAILGKAIGKPGLTWQTVSDEQFLNGLLAAGMNSQVARGLTEMNAGRRGGVLYADYNRNKPVLSSRKLEDFAGDFAVVYQQQ